MRCRYCLRHELGFCVKHGGRKPTWREPLMLRLADGRCFPLHFDCKNCQMLVLSDKQM
jgi:putative protease